MKLTIYCNDGIFDPGIIEVDATPVEIDPRLKTCIHRTSFDTFLRKWWAVSEITTGCRIGEKARTRKEAVVNAGELLKANSDEKITEAMAAALNRTSTIGEFIAFELPRTA